MLFNSHLFIFAFLPIVLLGYFHIARRNRRLAIVWLALASLFFYGWWNPLFVVLLLASILFNYLAGRLICLAPRAQKSKIFLGSAITTNLLLLGVFKYANFFIQTANSLGGHFRILDVVLPLGISFFTFTQITFLVDAYRGIAKEYNFFDYLLFVTWFPHLIAGPVLHHKQMMPQFSAGGTYRLNPEAIAVGLTLFAIGLFKKVVFADQFALYANPVFDGASQGQAPMFVEAWVGALAYTFQLYFDFSGYSDMAIGLSKLFNIRLPLNFNSPYKAQNIIEFWRRWHITLSTFLRDYLYIPLGGNRKGTVRRHVNIMITMLLGGLWHGAGWTFVLWGGLHGLYLVGNHAWRAIMKGKKPALGSIAPLVGHALTFAAVVFAWVPFRAVNLESALVIWKGMMGGNGVSLPLLLKSHTEEFLGQMVEFSSGAGPLLGAATAEILVWLALGCFVVWFLPNSQQWLACFRPAWDFVQPIPGPTWRPTSQYAVILGVLFATSLLLMNRISPFLYYQF